MIKKTLLLLFVISAMIFSSCSNKVDLYSDEGSTTIVYAILDSDLDTNYFKITKSFIGNVNELAQNYEANNYQYDDIDVTLSGIFEGSSVEQNITLDTTSKWIPYDENSTFYSGCRQTYYYTTQKLREGQKYTLNILRKEDNVNVTASTNTINNYWVLSPTVGIDPNVILDKEKVTLKWSFGYATSLASYFEVSGYFNYREIMPGPDAQETKRTIVWHIKSDKAESFHIKDNEYGCSFSPRVFFNVLENDTYLNENSPVGVQRYFDDFEYRVSALGDDLYKYYMVNNSTSAIQDTPNYSNVDNGIGLMASRVAHGKKNPIKMADQRKIADDYNYGFIPGKE